MKNVVFMFFRLLLTAGLLSGQPAVRINEFVAGNSSGYQDEDNEFEDWIEIYNDDTLSVNLSGYTLTDDLKKPSKWIFPAVTINPHTYLIIWASGKDRYSQFCLHSNFKLDKSGEQLGLFSPHADVVDSLTFAAQFTDISFGRFPDGGQKWYYLTPTPNAANMSTVDPPRFSAEQGLYFQPVTVDIHSETAGAIIRYSVDGSDITEKSPQWPGPLAVSQSILIRAAAFRGREKSPVVTKTYLINEDATIPTVSIAIDPKDLYDEATGIYANWNESGDAWERPGALTYFQSDHDFGFSLDSGFRIHGSSSREFPKKSFRIYFRSEYGSALLKYDLFPKCSIEQFDRLVLHNGSSDGLFYPGRWTLIKNALVADIARSGCVLSARGRLVAVFLNGENWGIYYLRERIDKNFLDSHFGTDQFELLKGNTTVNLDVELGSDALWKNTYNFFETTSFSADANYQKAQTLIDIDCFIDYQIIGSLIGDHDWPHNNFYMLRKLSDDTRWRWLLWDSDHAFANNYREDVTLNSIEWIIRSSPRPDLKLFGSKDNVKYLWGTLMLRKLLENKTFKQRFISRYADVLNTFLSEKNLSCLVDSLRIVLAPNINKEYRKWSDFTHKDAWPFWEENISFLHNYVNTRQDIIRGYLNQTFQLKSFFNLTVDVSGGGSVKVNTIYPDSFPWTGKYFGAYPVILKAEGKSGAEFLGWSDPSLPPRDSVEVTLTSNYKVTALFSKEVFKQKIDFDPGWTLFSLAVAPRDDLNLLSLLAPIQSNLVKVVDENGHTIEKLFGTWQNYIGDWQPTEGYMLKVDSSASLVFSGYDIATPFDIQLTKGWNIISYVCRENKQDAIQLFESLIADNELIKVIDRKGQSLEQIFGIWQNYIGNVKPDEGLKVKVNKACLLTLNCSTVSLAKERVVQKPHYFRMEAENLFQPMQLYFDQVHINDHTLSDGDEIAVFDGEQLVGATVYQANPDCPFLVVAGKSDGSLPGFIEDNPISVKVWRKGSNDVVLIDNTCFTTFNTEGQQNDELRFFRGLSSVVLKIAVKDQKVVSLPTATALYQNYPNPFNPTTTIAYTVPEKAIVTLKIYDIRGVLVRMLDSGEKQAGRHVVLWDGRDDNGLSVSAGLYICSLMCGDVVQTRKLLFIK